MRGLFELFDSSLHLKIDLRGERKDMCINFISHMSCLKEDLLKTWIVSIRPNKPNNSVFYAQCSRNWPAGIPQAHKS